MSALSSSRRRHLSESEDGAFLHAARGERLTAEGRMRIVRSRTVFLCAAVVLCACALVTSYSRRRYSQPQMLQAAPTTATNVARTRAGEDATENAVDASVLTAVRTSVLARVPGDVHDSALAADPSEDWKRRGLAADGVQGADANRRLRLKVGLLMLVVDKFPIWWPYLVASYQLNAPHVTLIAVHTGARPRASTLTDAHIVYHYVPLSELIQLFARKLGISNERASAKFASGKGLSDLKPFYGKVFEDMLTEFTHFGWVDWDVIVGDLVHVIGEEALWQSDALTFGGATLGFAWAGQLSILRNTPTMRGLYSCVEDHIELGFKSTGDGQSGWEERVWLRQVLRKLPHISIHFHMAAQFDHKAQWLTWVPFDHFWHRGHIWRCGKRPLVRKGRPPYILTDKAEWLHAVVAIQTNPRAFYRRKERVCIRWDLESSPWLCCPHATGVSYFWRNGTLSGEVTGYGEAPARVLSALSDASRSVGARMRLQEYDVCHEGAFFHAGLTPLGNGAPECLNATWSLQDEIGRFSGTLQLVQQSCTK